jgi:DNA-binding NtrC family response regulator
MAQILVVDDEVGIRELLSEILEDEGHQVALAESAGDARRIRERARPDLVLLDIWMPDTDGITLLKEWAASGQLNMPVVMMSGTRPSRPRWRQPASARWISWKSRSRCSGSSRR